MKNLRDNCCEEEGRDNQCCPVVEIGFKLDDSSLVKSFELLELRAGNCGSNPRVASGTFAGANHSAFADSHTFNLIGMNGATVVTTRGLSGKSMNLSATSAVNYVHGVSGINFTNLMPTDFETLQGVDDQDSLVKENNFGVNEDQIEKCASENPPNQGAEGCAKTVINNVDVNQGADCKEGAKTHDITTAWSEGLEVTHLTIFSRQERRAA